MAQQWGGGQPGFQYPMQTGFQGNPGQFQPGFNQGIAPQQTGFPGQRPPFQQPQQTGFPGIQPQQTGFPGASGFQSQPPPPPPLPSFQQQPPPPPPVPPLPNNFSGAQGFGGSSFQYRAPPPPPPQGSFINPSPAFGGASGGGLAPQMTGFPGAAAPLVPQVTGYVDPRLQMMSTSFMPANPSAPYTGGAPQFQAIPNAQPGTSLVQNIQQYNQDTSTPNMSWVLTRAEKKNYDQIFRAWDAQGTGFISGQMALEVFGQSGLDKNSLAKIWSLADTDNRGKLNLAEFHVAMGLIYRKLNGMEIPDQLPPELVPPSSRDLDTSVNFLKDILKHDNSRPGSALSGDVVSRSKVRSFNDTSAPGAGSRKDGTVYKHTEDEDNGSYYRSRSRHIDRRDVRVGNESPGDDLESMRRTLENTAKMLDRSKEEQNSRTREDEELEREMEDLRYRVKRIQEDLEFVSRGPRSYGKDEERRKLERDLLHLMHERIPEVQRKQEERQKRREREQREWTRERDRRNEKFGKFDERNYDSGYSRTSYDRDRSRDRDYDRDRDFGRDRDRDRDRDHDYDRGYGRDRDRDREYDDRDRSYGRDRDRPRSPPVNARSPPPPPPAAPVAASNPPPPAPKPSASPAPMMKSMSAEERQAYIREQAQRKLQERMRALGVSTPGPASDSPSSPSVDTSVEDRLAREKEEAQKKAAEAEKAAEERERARRERLDAERALKEGSKSPAPAAASPMPAPSVPSAAATKPPPPPVQKRAPAPPPPMKRGAAPKPPVASPAAPSAPVAVPVAPAPPPVQEEDAEEKLIREREERLRKQKEEREARLRQLEKEEEEARLAEEQYRARRQQFMSPKQEAAPIPPVQATVSSPPPPPPPAPPVMSPPAATPSLPASSPGAGEKSSTNPFNKLMQGNGSAASPSTGSGSSTNPFFKPPQASAAPAPPSVSPAPPAPPVMSQPIVPPPVTRSPAPPTINTSYNTAPVDDDEDWGDAKELEDDDSSDDEIMSSRQQRDKLAQQIFGGGLSRPQSAAAGSTFQPHSQPQTPPPMSAPAAPAPPPPPPVSQMPALPSTESPAAPPPPPMAPPAPIAPPAPMAPLAPPPPATSAPAPAAPAGDRSALLSSIMAGKKLRKAVTNDRSAASITGSVIGDSAPPSHINAAPRPASPPVPVAAVPPTPVTQDDESATRHAHRQSVDWYAGLAADQGKVSPMPAMAEEKEEEEHAPVSVPAIQVDSAPVDESPDPMDDVDKSKQFRVRTLYPYEGQRPEDLSFAENIVLEASPSKSGGAWWYGVSAKEKKSGFFPSTYVQELESLNAKALYSYEGGNADELPFVEGDMLTIVDRSDADWWKTEQGGVIFIVPAAYLEVVDAESKNVNSHNADKVSGVGEAGPRLSSDREIGSVSMNKSKQAVEKQAVDASRPWTLSSNSNPDEADHEADFHEHELSNANASASNAPAPPALPSTSTSTLSPTPQFRMSIDRRPASPDDGVSENEEYHSFESSDEDDSGYEPTGGRRSEDERRAETEARELERLRVLEAAGLLVPGSMNGDSSHPTSSSQPTALIRRRSTNTKRRRRRTPPETPNRLSIISLPPLHTQSNSHSRSESEKELPTTPKSLLQIDDAFDRYEQYRQQQNYRLSVSSFDTGPPSPNSLGFGFPPTLSLTSSHDTRDGRDAADGTNTSGQAQGSSSNSESKSYSSIFNFLSRSKTHLSEPEKPKLQISGPIFNNSDKSLNETANGAATGSGEGRAFGSSWASLLDQSTLEGIPDMERKRQEAIFELINTEAAYVRDLQLIVEVFYSSMIPLLTEKEVTVVFANIEDLLLLNTTFLSSLEERQKDCRLYIDNVGDLLQQHMRSMDVYSEYCINQANAIKILQGIRNSRPELASHLERLRDDPAVRNLDLSSYLLEPMQRITRYPLLIRQVLHYTQNDADRDRIGEALKSVERVLNHINEAIREQEGRARLQAVSKNLYVGQGRLDLAKSTSYMGQRKLLREGTLCKHKSGRKLRVFLCNDMIVLTDEAVSRLYKMPIQLNQVEAKELTSKDETAFQLVFAYPRGGEAMAFKASSAKDCQSWIKDISRAGRRARELERRAARASMATAKRRQSQSQSAVS